MLHLNRARDQMRKFAQSPVLKQCFVLMPFAISYPDLKNSVEHLAFDNCECGFIACGRIAI